MPDSIISVVNLEKKYNLYGSPGARLKEAIHPMRKSYHKEFYALSSINFNIGRGETVGIVGKNGSGKSTLLKILTGVLTATKGSVDVKGKVSALLELGAGFNPELTGLENIFFSGSIMGYSRKEIDASLQDIIEFADIGEFIYQPVKVYSSGMFVRLAFSIAINVDPDILIVDEALAVGDALFQSKCMMRMKQMMEAGTTVLFVSHDLVSLKALCSRGILLDRGKIIEDAEISVVAEKYFNLLNNESSPVDVVPSQNKDFGSFEDIKSFMRITSGSVEITDVKIIGGHSGAFNFKDRIEIGVSFTCSKDVENLSYGYHVRDRNGVDVLYSDSNILEIDLPRLIRKDESYKIVFGFDVLLADGDYTVSIVLSSKKNDLLQEVEFHDFIPIAGQFRVHTVSPKIYGRVSLPTEVTIQKI